MQALHIKQNLLGGITAAVVALPLALAFGVASGLGATAGLYGAIVLGFFASLFGGTDTQISGPTGPMTVIMASGVSAFNGEIGPIMATVMLAGLFQIAFGIFKIGKFVRYIPYPVISGFMSGIGIIIIILQINPFLGLESNAKILDVIFNLPSNLLNIHYTTFFLALASLAIVFFTPRKITKIIPAPLIALLVLTPISAMGHLSVATIGHIPVGLPEVKFPDFNLSNIKPILTFGLTLAVLGTIDTLLTSIVADSVTRTKHNPNKELIGQGIGNSLCALVGANPGAGATMRTVININSGGTNNISGMTHSVILLMVVLFLAPIASQIPMAVLSGILIKVGVDILDYRFLQIIKQAPKNDLIVMLSVFFVTVFVDLITAVGLGVVLASLLVVYRITKETKIELSGEACPDIDFNEEGLRVVSISGAFFFGSSTAFEAKVDEALGTKHLVLDIKQVPFLDITAIFTLKDLILKLEDKMIKVSIVLQQQQLQQLKDIDKRNVFKNINFKVI